MISSFETSSPFPLDQQAEQIEGARAECDRRRHTPLIETKETAAPLIEAEALEQNAVSRADPVHPPVLQQERHDP